VLPNPLHLCAPYFLETAPIAPPTIEPQGKLIICRLHEFCQVPQKQRLTAAGSTHGSGRLRNSFRNDCRIFGGSSSPTCPGK
jgi:hypothetical protein